MQADAQSGQIGLEQGGAEAWAGIFDRCETYVAGTQRFRVYSAGIEEGKEKTTLLLLHGAGHCALSWALCAQILKPFTRVIAYDARMHGATESDSTDLSVESLVEDLTRVVEGFCPQEGDRQPPFVLIGHSLGGAIAIKAAAHANWPGLQGVILLDTVEGIAQQSFSTTASLLRMRPTFFESPDAAVQWALRSGMLANRDSAILSVPASLRSVVRQGTPGWEWIMDMSSSERYWKGWFQDASKKFLSLPCGKLLILSSADHRDPAITIGHMQGKFQLEVVPGGHAIQEDHPREVSRHIIQFLQRRKLCTSVLLTA
eukprot:CAMPEP_0184291074 /NCGR_PEP_ID=MMETSP1049-20130417/3177_1 /TAXON_ID=77928 /ORGANISM="Proteomonas sulcata, Strain CCMP704" /LENGTH=314 /DNA_ID=CAMNT_0026598393 /DNA_START=353 /DNA_END=1294 /DNA_ORIENTATION=-